jgi:DNA invertase Pin-like site-specific DNA recombinase
MIEMVESRSVGTLIVRDTACLATNPVLRGFLLSRIHHAECRVWTLDCQVEDPRFPKIRDVVGLFIGASDEYQSAIQTHRMRMGKEAKALTGGYVGGRPPYGMQVCNGKLVLHPEEAKTIGLMMELRDAGNSYRAICSILDDLGIKSRSIQRWQPMTIRRIVDRATKQNEDLTQPPSSEPRVLESDREIRLTPPKAS